MSFVERERHVAQGANADLAHLIRFREPFENENRSGPIAGVRNHVRESVIRGRTPVERADIPAGTRSRVGAGVAAATGEPAFETGQRMMR